jgi:hypothetical protein
MRLRRAAIALVGVLAGAVPAAALDLGDGLVRLRTGSFRVDEGPPAANALDRGAELAAEAVDALDSWIVAYAGPSDAGLIESIEAGGASIRGFVPSNAYLVRMRVSDVEALRTRDGILRIDRVRGAWKIAPEIGRVAGASGADPEPHAGGTDLRLVIDVFDDVPRSEVIARLSEAGAQLVAVSETVGAYRCRARARGSDSDTGRSSDGLVDRRVRRTRAAQRRGAVGDSIQRGERDAATRSRPARCGRDRRSHRR